MHGTTMKPRLSQRTFLRMKTEAFRCSREYLNSQCHNSGVREKMFKMTSSMPIDVYVADSDG